MRRLRSLDHDIDHLQRETLGREVQPNLRGDPSYAARESYQAAYRRNHIRLNCLHWIGIVWGEKSDLHLLTLLLRE